MDLDYADCIKIVGESFADIQSAIDEMQFYTSELGIKVNTRKTKLLTAGFLPTEKWQIVLDWEILEEVDHFKYLGSVVTVTCRREKDIYGCIGNAWVAYFRLHFGLGSRQEIKLATKIRI